MEPALEDLDLSRVEGLQASEIPPRLTSHYFWDSGPLAFCLLICINTWIILMPSSWTTP